MSDSSRPLPDSPRAPQIDASAMKAFAHPLRMRMYAWLTDHGPATATTLAEHLQESTGQTSYHIRQLAKHGFVEEDTGRGRGRERWWRSRGFSMPGHEFAQDPAALPALQLMLRTQREQRNATVRDWFLRAAAEDPSWTTASLDNTSTMTMTAAQMQELSDALLEVIHQHSTRAKEAGPSQQPTRVVRAYIDLFPLADPDAPTEGPGPAID